MLDMSQEMSKRRDRMEQSSWIITGRFASVL